MSELTEESARKRASSLRTLSREKSPEVASPKRGGLAGLHSSAGNQKVSRDLRLAVASGHARLPVGSASPAAARALLRVFTAESAAAAIAQREGDADLEEDDEKINAKHSDTALAQREGEMGEDEEELVSAKHSDAALAQREGEMGEDEEELVSAKHSDAGLAQREGEIGEDEEELVSAKHEHGATVGAEGGALDDSFSQRIESQRGTGSGLTPDVQSRMEGHFGQDFSGVRVHQDGESDSLAAGMSARAFTTGSDIYLRSSERAGDTNLMAHELTHVVQQSSMPVEGTQASGMTVGAASDPLEIEADREAAAMNAGAGAQLLKDEQH